MKIKYWVRTDNVGSICEDEYEIDDDEWELMTEQEREEWILELAMDYVDWGYEVE